MGASVAFPSAAYSEGTWTPVLTFATPGDLSVAYTTQIGWWKKIGNLVVASCNLVTSTFTHTTASGNLQITGLPYAEVNTAGIAPSAAVGFGGFTKANFTQMMTVMSAGSATVTFNMAGSAQAYSSVNAADMPTGGTVTIRFVQNYFTA